MEENHRLLTGTDNVCTALTSPILKSNHLCRGHHQIVTHKRRVEERRDLHWILRTLNPGAEVNQPHPSCLPQGGLWYPTLPSQHLNPTLELGSELFLNINKALDATDVGLVSKPGWCRSHKASEKQAITTLQISGVC